MNSVKPWTYAERQIIQLLTDHGAFLVPHGSAMSLEDSHLRSASYGPNSSPFSGSGFPERGRNLLRRSLMALDFALDVLEDEDPEARLALSEFYGGEGLGSSGPERLREKLPRLKRRYESAWRDYRRAFWEWAEDPEAVTNPDVKWIAIRAELATSKRKQAYQAAEHRYRGCQRDYREVREDLERHDRGIRRLARLLRDEDLYVDFARPYSADEERKVEDANASMRAAVARKKREGKSERVAVGEVATERDVSRGYVERVMEFVGATESECLEDGCGKSVKYGGYCEAHYRRRLRARRKAG